MFVEQPSGIVAATIQAGTYQSWIEWLRNFRGRLITSISATPRADLGAALLTSWAEHAPLMAATFPQLTERQRFIAFITLRVGGSFITYAVRSTVPNELDSLLMSHRGNCGDHAVRLAMALDSVGIATAIISVNTPTLPGHMIVDAYDPVDGSGYLLDSLFNVILRYDGAGTSFITKWISLTPQQRIDFFDVDGAHDLLFNPTYFRFVDGGPAGFTTTPVTDQSMNEVDFAARRAAWRVAMTSEWANYTGWWHSSYPYQPPRTLAEMGSALAIPGIQQFGPQLGIDTSPMWQAAGLSVYDPSAFKVANNPPFED